MKEHPYPCCDAPARPQEVDYPCRECGAEPGSECVWRGRHVKSAHRSRRDKVFAAEKKWWRAICWDGGHG